MQKEHIAFIVKEHQRKKQLLDNWFDFLRTDFHISVHTTQYAGHAVALTQECIHAGATRILAVGGDGTLHEVVNGLMSSDRAVPFLYLPNGTANDWGKTFAPPSTPSLLASRLKQPPTRVDVGCIKFTEEGTNTYFINIADCGMGAEVVQRVNRSSNSLPADLKFASAILQTFYSFKNQPVQVVLNEEPAYVGKIRAVIVANGKYFGSGLCIAPEASPADGQFEVVIIGDVSVWDYLRYVPKLKKGERINHRKVSYHKATSVQIRNHDLGTEADGEFIGQGNVSFSLLPLALSIL